MPSFFSQSYTILTNKLQDANVANIETTQRMKKLTEHKVKVNDLEKSAALEEVIFAIRRQEEKEKVYAKRTGEYEGRLSGNYMF